MNGVPAVYMGKIVPKENFRVYIYSYDGVRKLVTSWDEYEKHMGLGVWFAKYEDAVRVIDMKDKKLKK